MAKIFWYECRRLLCSKGAAGLLVVTVAYSHVVMEGEILFGVAGTAPFSPWSFGVYLARVLPLLLAGLLLFLAPGSSRQAEGVRVLTRAACTRPAAYRAVRWGAVAAAFVLLTLAPVLYALWVYGSVFRFWDLWSLLPPLALAWLPAGLLGMGLGLWAGRLRPWAVFALMPLVLLMGVLPLPGWLDLYGAGFFAQYPASLGQLDPAFSVPWSQGLGRGLCALAGGLLTLSALAAKEKVRR